MNGVEKYAALSHENKAIEFEGLSFWPLSMREYLLYRRASTAMELLQSSLPPKLARLSWAHCLDEMDKMGQCGVFLKPVLLIMAKALRLDPVQGPGGVMEYPIFPLRNKDTGALTAIFIRPQQVLLSIQQMDEVRLILAAQNDYSIPDENWNSELVEAQQYLAGQQQPNLKTEIDAWVYAVAVNSGRDADEIWDWPIRKFKGYDKAIDRSLGYQIYTLAHAAGFVKFENGVPFPSWKFDKTSELPYGFKELGQLEAKAKGVLPEPTKM